MLLHLNGVLLPALWCLNSRMPTQGRRGTNPPTGEILPTRGVRVQVSGFDAARHASGGKLLVVTQHIPATIGLVQGLLGLLQCIQAYFLQRLLHVLTMLTGQTG